jgi:hypothetical protein
MMHTIKISFSCVGQVTCDINCKWWHHHDIYQLDKMEYMVSWPYSSYIITYTTTMWLVTNL